MEQVRFIAGVSKEIPITQAQRELEQAGFTIIAVQHQIRTITGTAETVRAVVNFAHPQIQVEIERINQTQE